MFIQYFVFLLLLDLSLKEDFNILGNMFICFMVEKRGIAIYQN